MRVVIDMQGAQTESRFRGIGRYTMGLALGLARNAGEHEILLAVNGSLGESADAIEQAFKEYLPSDHIKKCSHALHCPQRGGKEQSSCCIKNPYRIFAFAQP